MQGQNKYYPPDYDPSMGSLNKMHGKHALGDRARKLHQGILIVTFELPWPVFCNHCKTHIGKGVRWNAEKSQDGMYLSTKIWKFALRCHICSGTIVIRTDPQNRDYAIVEGATRKTMEYTADDAGVIDLPDETERKKMYDDPFFKLEHEEKDKKAGKESHDHLLKLLAVQRSQHEDNYRASRLVRSQFRKRKADDAAAEKANIERGIYVPLVAEDPADVQLAARTVFGSKAKREKLKKKEPTSIFAAKPKIKPK